MLSLYLEFKQTATTNRFEDLPTYACSPEKYTQIYIHVVIVYHITIVGNGHGVGII